MADLIERDRKAVGSQQTGSDQTNSVNLKERIKKKVNKKQKTVKKMGGVWFVLKSTDNRLRFQISRGQSQCKNIKKGKGFLI